MSQNPAIAAIPNGWAVEALGNLCTFENGDRGKNYPTVRNMDGVGLPFVNAGDLNNGAVQIDSSEFISQQAYDSLGAGKFKPKDILFCLRGSLGKFAQVADHIGVGAIASSLIIIRPQTALLDDEFLLAYLGSPQCTDNITQWSGGAAQPNLGGAQLQRFSILWPPLAEQKAIARALEDIDDLIISLDALIAKKKDIKQAAMQQLLTGETRLPGFSEAWKTKQIGEVGRFLKGSGIRRDQALSGDIPCVRYGEIYTIHRDVVRQFESYISADVAKSATLLQSGDLLFAGSGETKEEIGKCVAFVDEREAYAGGDIVILRPNWGNPVFLGYLLNAPHVVRQKANQGQGDAVVHISARALAAITSPMPEPMEQSAISEVLTNMDDELASLVTKRSKSAQLREGMMQQLLTGRIRLV